MDQDFLPISKEDIRKRGWNDCDIILITGDAYVDHPSYGVSIIGRFLEWSGFKVGIISQPDWRNTKDFIKLGKPRLFFGITSGNVDSMVSNYTANKKPRKKDDYSPGCKIGKKPDRAIIVYANRIKESFPDTPIVIGGIEASLRRLAHYDYWDNKVRGSIILDSRADILVYGMGEKQVLEIAQLISQGNGINSLNNIKGTAVIRKNIDFLEKENYVLLPSFEEVTTNKDKFNKAFKIAYFNQNPSTAKILVQKYQNRFLVQFPPIYPLVTEELDKIYELPFTRKYHPIYKKEGGVPSWESIKYSITSCRGCCGECSFCSLYFHQGRIVQSRSSKSILREIKTLGDMDWFKGTITDIGGPTANLYKSNCHLWEKGSFCKDKNCLVPHKCSNLQLGYKESLELFKEIRKIPKIQHLFIGSGFRHDLLIDDYAEEYLYTVCKNHISGYMKAAPEYNDELVLKIMRKPSFKTYEKFVEKFNLIRQKLSKKIYLVNYFISAHPASSLKSTLNLAKYLLNKKIQPEQIQDFIPLPMTLSGCIYYTEEDPFSGEKIYVPKTFRERKMHRALLQPQNQSNKKFIVEALKKLKSYHLINKLFLRRSKPR